MSTSHNAPRDSPVVATDEPTNIRVTVKSSTEKQDFQVAGNSTVEQLKEEACLRFMTSKEQTVLIFAGKILKDQDTLLQHNIQDGVTVHLVVKKPELRNDTARQTNSVAPGSRAFASPASTSDPSDIQAILASTRKDLVALLEILSELPQHFQACPELLSQVVQSPTIQSMMSSDCGPLAVALILGVSTLISLSTSRPSSGKEKVVSREEISQALEKATTHDILANIKEMAQFLSESPELKHYAEEMPHFSRLMSPSGLTKMMEIYKQLPHLGPVALDPGPDDMGLLGDMWDEVHSFRQLFMDICKVLSSPEAQEELEERMLRHALATNPSLQQLAEENVDVRHMLNNPQVMGEIITYIRSPEIRREMDRHCDRTLSNLESLPGGFNVLQHIYQEFEEPIWNLVQDQREGDLFATLGSSGGAHPLPCIENRSPLPDPWAPRLDTAAASKPGKSRAKGHATAEEDVSHSQTPALKESLVATHSGNQESGGSGAHPRAGMPDVRPLSEAQPDSPSQRGDPPAQDRSETQAVEDRSEDQEEPHVVRTGLSPGESSQALVEKEEGAQTATDAPVGSEPS